MALSENQKFNYEALIRKVKLYPAVFDSKHEMHKNRAYVNELWRQISEGLRCTDTLCREKWANLRSNYMRETRKLRIRRIEGKPLKVTWPYFHLLEFLNPTFHKKIQTDMALNSENQDDERLVIDLNADATTTNADIEEPTDDDGLSNSNKNSFSTTINSIEQDGYGNAKRKRKTWRPEDNDRDCIERLIRRVKEVSDSQTISEDQDRMFLLSLLPFMKRLSATENLQFRLDVQEILLQKIQQKSPKSDTERVSV